MSQRHDHAHHYIDGEWVEPAATATMSVIDSSTEQPFGSAPAGTAADVARAVAAATRAFGEWSTTSPAVRADVLDVIADGLAGRRDELADLIARETGMPVSICMGDQVDPSIDTFRYAAALTRSYEFEQSIDAYQLLRHPIGVVGCITPWNYPLLQISAKVAFALGAGCTVVLKPSEIAPLDAFVLAQIVHDSALPAGVFNLVAGTGTGVGEPLASHPDIAMVSFTGSTVAGSRVAALGAANITKVALELGGKSASVLLEDLSDDQFAEAVDGSVRAAFTNSGQTCSATSRMLVPRNRLEHATALAAAVAEGMTVGDPFESTSELGPLASAQQWDRVQAHIAAGIDEGAVVVTGGAGRPDGLDTGYYVRPTVFSDVTADMHIVRQELFGPVLVVMAYDGHDDAARLANDTEYGLSGAVWASDRDTAAKFARRLRTGEVDLNGGGDWDPSQPFGGFGRSGIGREFGVVGFEEFLETTTLR